MAEILDRGKKITISERKIFSNNSQVVITTDGIIEGLRSLEARPEYMEFEKMMFEEDTKNG